MNFTAIFTKTDVLFLWILVVLICTQLSHGVDKSSSRSQDSRRIYPARTTYSRKYYAPSFRDRPTYAMLRARNSDRTSTRRVESGPSEPASRRTIMYPRRIRRPVSSGSLSSYPGKKYISTPARRIYRIGVRRGDGGRIITTRRRYPTFRRLPTRVRVTTTTKATTSTTATTTKVATNATTVTLRKRTRPSSTEITITTTRRTRSTAEPVPTLPPTRVTVSTSATATTTRPPPTTTIATTTSASSTTTVATTTTRKPVKKNPSSRPPTTVSTTTRRSTRAVRRGPYRPAIYSQRRTQHTSSRGETSPRVDYYSSYYYAMAQTERRMGDLLNKQIKRSREDNAKLWKGIFSVQADVREVDRSCTGLKKNITDIAGKVGSHSKELDKYKEAHKQKIDQIEAHQGSQDSHYYQVYQTSTNNSRLIEDLEDQVGTLGPIVADLAMQVEETNKREQKALEMLTSHTRDSFAGMSNQIRVQQRTVANLGNQVRTELDLLHAVKQSMSRRMEQNQRKLSEDVNAHLSTHTSQINRVETTLSRQTERIKHLNEVVRRHNDLLNTDDVMDISLMKHVDNITNYLGMMYTNLTRVSVAYFGMQEKVSSMEGKLAMLSTTAHRATESFANHSKTTRQLRESYSRTAQEVERISNHLGTLTQKHDDVSETLRTDLDKALETQKVHHKNISTIMRWNADSRQDRRLSQYFADEPESGTPLHVTATFRRLLIELGVEDRLSRLTRVIRLQQYRMSNVTKAVRKLAEDKEQISDTATHYLSIVRTQADLIKGQNKTISKLAMMIDDQDMTIDALGEQLMLEQDRVRKLTNIIANMAASAKDPLASQRDCHDVWLNGHRDSGVYNIIENMKLRPVQCNLTEYGGWTVIQNRRDGSQDFDQTHDDYRHGFGDVYGEYWLGLDGIKTITQKVRTNTALRILMEDWNGETRSATYSHFYLYGKGFSISISGYEGDAGDSLSSANGLQFSAKVSDEDYGNACNSRRHAGWWHSTPRHDCGACNLNGEYVRFPDIKTSHSSAIYWKGWHGTGYPLKRVSMQIIPTEVLDNLDQTYSETLDSSLEGIDSSESENGVTDYLPPEESYGENAELDDDAETALPSLDYNPDYDGLFMNDG